MRSPVLILALDTTTRAGSAALVDDDRIRAVVAGDASRTHGERLPGELANLLDQAQTSLADVDLLAVASGPGAFTGLRIGLAAMQGLAMTLGRPVIGVSALEAMAAAAFEVLAVPRALIGAWMDAARGEVFAARYDATGEPGTVPTLEPLEPPEVAAPHAVWSRWRDDAAGMVLVGDGAERYGDLVAPSRRVIPHPVLAPAVARLARRRIGDDGPHLPHRLHPLYVRRPDAERGPPS